MYTFNSKSFQATIQNNTKPNPTQFDYTNEYLIAMVNFVEHGLKQKWFHWDKKDSLSTSLTTLTMNEQYKNYNEVSSTIDKVQRIEIPDMNGKAYILDYNGNKVLKVTSELSSLDMLNLNKNLGKMKIKPEKLHGNTIDANQILSYKELINPNMQMLQKNKPNLSIHLLLTGSLLMANSFLALKNKDKIKKIKQYVQKRKMQKEMYGKYDDEEDEKNFKELGLDKYPDVFEHFLKLQEDVKKEQIKSYTQTLTKAQEDILKINWDSPVIKESILRAYNVDNGAANVVYMNDLLKNENISGFFDKFLIQEQKNDLNKKMDYLV